jgi:uncharacterized protein YukE
MSLEGMDVDQLQSLAKQIDTDAQALYKLVTNLTDALGGLTFLWQGPVAATFEQDWRSKNRPALLAAYNTLTNLHTHLVNNIGQQISASAAEGGWTAERVVGDFENVLTGAGLVSMTKLLDGTRAGGVLDGLGYVGTAVGVYQTEHAMLDTDEDLGQGHYVAAANDYANGVGDGLETAGGVVFDDNPPLGAALIVGGIDVKLADQVANLDWKDTPSPFSGSNFQQDYVPVFKSMGTGAFWEQAGQTLWGDM